MKSPVNVVITGAAGQISYSLIFRIAKGEMLGSDQPINLKLLEITPALGALNGVVMEIEDCAFPLVNSITPTDNAAVAFDDAHYCLLVGARPRGPGMERKDLLEANANIFTAQGKAINDNANGNVKVLVVGNPANTNAYIAMKSAPDLSPLQFTAMTRLDHNRALTQLANKTNAGVSDVKNLCIWGNHSATMYADVTNATVKGKAATDLVDQNWIDTDFIQSSPNEAHPSLRPVARLLQPLRPTQQSTTCVSGLRAQKTVIGPAWVLLVMVVTVSLRT